MKSLLSFPVRWRGRAGRGAAAARQRGFSLVELMVAMFIGLVVIGAVLVNYLSSGASGRSGNALAQMAEDATMALNVIRSHVSQAGYSRPYGMTANGFQRAYTGQSVFGCAGSFTNVNVPAIGDLTCAAGGGSHALAVAYEADDQNALRTSVAAGNLLMDCVGAGITPVAAAAPVPAYTLAQARFYVDGGRLMCRGNGGTATATALGGAPQPLVENIQDMRIWYGLSANETVNGVTRPAQQVSRYVDASSVLAAQWNNVRAVRVCVVVRSVAEVNDQASRYIDCTGNTVLPNDRRLYRAFTTTIMVQNRLGG